MNCTVLGATGFIGRRLVRALERQGRTVWAPPRQSPEILREPLGVLFYCVGLTADYAQRPFDTVEAHVGYLAALLERAQFDHVVYLSSTRLYDGLDDAVADGATQLRFRPDNPRHLYDLSKALGENLCLTTARDRCGIARLSCVYDAMPESPGFLSELLQRFGGERDLVLDSSPGYCRDYVALDDAVDGLIALGMGRFCGIANVASGSNTFNQDIADTVRPHGFTMTFRRSGERMHLPRCGIEPLRELGVCPTPTLDAITRHIRKIRHV